MTPAEVKRAREAVAQGLALAVANLDTRTRLRFLELLAEETCMHCGQRTTAVCHCENDE